MGSYFLRKYPQRSKLAFSISIRTLEWNCIIEVNS
jgi:hypothetical protein